jgi:glycerol-3-phosphate dehydrogenase (NAD(P)+)
MHILIIGSGNFGTALAKVFSKNHHVHIYSIDEQAISDINNFAENKRYLPGVRLEGITAGNNLAIAKDNDVIVYAVPSQAARAVSAQLKTYYSGQIIISTSKGISPDGKVMTDIIEDCLGCRPEKIVALSGPSIAGEIALLKPSIVMLGGSRNTIDRLKCLETDNFFFKATTDKRGIQLLGFYKNIIALLSGLCESLRLGNNFKAALISKAYSEFYYLNIGKNIARHSFVDFAGLGDLYLTATSSNSRNRKFGLMLSKGMDAESIKKSIGQAVEGYENLLLLEKLTDKSYIDENLLGMLLRIIKGCKPSEIRLLLLKYIRAPEIKNIIFDWGNVITKGYYTRDVARALAKKYFLKEKAIFSALEKHEKNALLGKEDFLTFFKRIKRIFPAIKYAYFLEAYKNSISWDNQLIAYCNDLKVHYRLYLLSNNYSIITPLLKKSVLRELFDGMVFSNDVHMIKPRKDIFEYILGKYRLRPENCLFVDDSHANVKSAQKLKINTLQYSGLAKLRKDIAGLGIA